MEGKVKNESIIFNSQMFGNIFRKKCQLEACIKGIHTKLDNGSSSSLIAFEKHLQDQYNQILHQEEMLKYQKSREKWVRFGNKNT